MILILISLALSVIVNIVLAMFLLRASKRMLQFDDLFQTLTDDVDANIKYFTKLLNTPLWNDSTEVKDANRNMDIMRRRMQEFSIRLSETAGREVSDVVGVVKKGAQ